VSGLARITVAGAGMIGTRHIEEVDASPSAELPAVSTLGPGAVRTPELRQRGENVRGRKRQPSHSTAVWTFCASQIACWAAA
jgi:hypothetical protein